jgi:hypothetical protein
MNLAIYLLLHSRNNGNDISLWLHPEGDFKKEEFFEKEILSFSF